MGGLHSVPECVETILAGERVLLSRPLGPQAYCGDTTRWTMPSDSL